LNLVAVVALGVSLLVTSGVCLYAQTRPGLTLETSRRGAPFRIVGALVSIVVCLAYTLELGDDALAFWLSEGRGESYVSSSVTILAILILVQLPCILTSAPRSAHETGSAQRVPRKLRISVVLIVASAVWTVAVALIRTFLGSAP